MNLELARRYGRRSERRDADHPDQGYLFGEPPAEVPAESVDDDASGDPQEEASEPLESSTPKKRKGRNGRRRLPGHLPREETVLELEEDDRRCHCCAEPMGEIGREVSETLDYKPASLFVRRTIRPKYACQKCHEGVLTAEPPRGPIERGLPGPGLLAQVVVGKYADHLPLNRQESILARHGLEISRQTLSDWVAAVANLYTPIRDALKAQILKGPRIFTDDTQVRVLNPERRVKKPPGEKRKQKKGAQKGTLWVYVGDESTVFDYTKSRSRDGPLRFLEGYRGYLQADGFPGYRAVYRRGGVTEVACMAHARRKFHDARSNDRRRCRYALDRFGELYQIERDLKTESASAETRRAQREAVAVPILETFKAWLDTERARVLPKSPLGEAISYALNRWEAQVATQRTVFLRSTTTPPSARSVRLRSVARTGSSPAATRAREPVRCSPALLRRVVRMTSSRSRICVTPSPGSAPSAATPRSSPPRLGRRRKPRARLSRPPDLYRNPARPNDEKPASRRASRRSCACM